MTTNEERAKLIVKWLGSHTTCEVSLLDRLEDLLVINFDHVERGAFSRVRALLREYIEKNYIDQVISVVKEIERRVRHL